MKVFAYQARGFNHAEGSVRAIRECVRAGADLVLSVRLAKDAVWIVSPARKEQEVFKVHMRSSAQLKMPTLDVALAIIASFGSSTLLLDIQDHGEFRALARMIAAHGLQSRVVCCLWDPEELEHLHRMHPELTLGYSVPPGTGEEIVHRSSRKGLKQHHRPKHSFEAKGMSQFNVVNLPAVPLQCVNLFAFSCTKNVVAELQRRGIEVNGYLVGARITRGILRRVHVDGIIASSLQEG